MDERYTPTRHRLSASTQNPPAVPLVALRRTVIIAQTATDDYLSFPQSETDFANLVFTGSSALAAIGSYHVLTFDRFEQIDNNNNNNSSDHMQHTF